MKLSMIALLFFTAGSVGACSASSARDEPMDEDNAYEAAAEDVDSQSFEDVGDTSQCTQDCSGHNAGFEWAKQNDITDPSDCGGDSQSFQEGCEAYAQAVEEQASDYQEGTDE